MRKLGLLLLLAIALPLAASKFKHKEKSFEPVSITAAQAAGRYVGIDPDFVIELTSGGGTLRNFERTATLTHIVFDGSEMQATAEYAGGRREPLQVTFVNRIKNGETAFGLLVRNADVRIDESITIQNLFCRRQ
jgi:hypothetical protein